MGNMHNGDDSMSAVEDKDSGMTRSDAGRLGGQETARRHGSDHFRNIGKLGGEARGKNNK